MATATRSRSSSSSNGNAVVTKAKDAGSTITSAAQKAKGPAVAAGGAAIGLAGGLALGSHISGRHRGLSGLVTSRRKVLGVPLGRKSGLRMTVETLGAAARHFSSTTDDIRQVREELERANRQSPVEVLLNGLTHRRGAHRHERSS